MPAQVQTVALPCSSNSLSAGGSIVHSFGGKRRGAPARVRTVSHMLRNLRRKIMISDDFEVQDAVFGIEQALSCFAAGQDLDEPETLAAAFASYATLDFRQPAAILGVAAPIMRGRDEIVSTIVAATEHLVTSHTVSNVRVRHLSEGRANAHALIEAMHIERLAPDRRLLLKNSLDIDAVRADGVWKIISLRFDNLWKSGAGEVLFPAASKAVAQ